MKKINFEIEIPDYQKESSLFKILLLESRLFTYQENEDKTKENLIASASFLAHLSSENLNTIIKNLIEGILFKIALPSFNDSLKYDTIYLNDLNFFLKPNTTKPRLYGKIIKG